tara:strand:+ start:20 stop:430 length:411 start_codon:yes stop_codon:yes gene_type:complete
MGRPGKGEVAMTDEQRKAARVEYNRRYYKKSGRTSDNKPLPQLTCQCGGTYRDTEALKVAHLNTLKHTVWMEEQDILPLYVEAGVVDNISSARTRLDAIYKHKHLISPKKREGILPKVKYALKLRIAERNNINIII